MKIIKATRFNLKKGSIVIDRAKSEVVEIVFLKSRNNLEPSGWFALCRDAPCCIWDKKHKSKGKRCQHLYYRKIDTLGKVVL